MSLFSFAFCLLAGSLPQDLPPASPARVESFVLFERGRVWRAERQELGHARMSTWTSRGAESHELLFVLDPIGTRVQRVLRKRLGETTYSWREWRESAAEGSEAGRTLVLERGARDVHLREWAGRAMRSEVAPKGRTTLELVDEARNARGFRARTQLHIDPLEVRSALSLVLETPLAWGLPGAPRVASILPLDGGMRPSHWVFAGAELMGFVEGGIQASRRPQPADQRVAIGPALPTGM